MTPDDGSDVVTSTGTPSPRRTDSLIPARLGPYRVLHLLGEGGMGAVYKVEQDHPHRIVALKVIRPGLATSELLRRFERESEVLARLHHPGIAQIYEAGTADAGYGLQPYFAMEFIRGETLREYSRSHNLDSRARLELMARVCDAVEHAHQRGVIHRDLKPGNILVDETGQPKILDFGVARITDSDAHSTKQTEMGELIGTLAYMSPEQVLADPLELDTRSDVYTLGVILYELLAGRLPYEMNTNVLAAARAIREDEPSRLSSISRAYRGDVETIVAKALEKDKSRRYSSAAALAADVRRYLTDLPITARPASATYQLRKFARRHKALVTATFVVMTALVGGLFVSARAAVRARQAEQAAEAVSDFLQNDVLAQASAATQSGPNAKPDPDVKVRTALDRAAARISGRFAHQPEIEGAVRYTIGRTYLDLGMYPEGRTQFERALKVQRQTLGAENATTLRTMGRLGRTAELQGNYPEAETLFTQALAIQRRLLGAEDPDTLYSENNLAEVYFQQGKYAEAEALNAKVLATQRRVFGTEHPSTLATMNSLANAYDLQGKHAEAEALHAQALELQRKVLGPEHPDTLITMDNLASDYNSVGKYAQAAALYRQALDIQRRVLGPEHPDVAMTIGNLGHSLAAQGDYSRAEALFRQALEINTRAFGAENFSTLISMESLASACALNGKPTESEALFDKTLDISTRVLGPEHPMTLATLADSASLYEQRTEYALAEPRAIKALEGRRKAYGSDNDATMSSAGDLALLYVSEGKLADAESLALESLEFARKKQPDEWQRYGLECLLGAIRSGQKRYAEAEPLLLEGYRRMVERKDRMGAPNLFLLHRVRDWIVRLYEDWGRPDEAAKWKLEESSSRAARM
jgi:tetratricopeptide (TPR) repeat protein/predicted Ser/Thr protein kinase